MRSPAVTGEGGPGGECACAVVSGAQPHSSGRRGHSEMLRGRRQGTLDACDFRESMSLLSKRNHSLKSMSGMTAFI